VGSLIALFEPLSVASWWFLDEGREIAKTTIRGIGLATDKNKIRGKGLAILISLQLGCLDSVNQS